MKAVNVDDVLKILHKYGKYIFVTDDKKYSDMVDEIANLKALKQEPVLDKIKSQIRNYLRGVEITLEVLVENDPLRPKMEGAKTTLEECLKLIDKAESEET